MAKEFFPLPADLPVPIDDGAAAHLRGLALPDLALPSTDGSSVKLAELRGRCVIYVYPRTGQPGVDLPEAWDATPGARGCTPQSCAFRDPFCRTCSAGRCSLRTQFADQRVSMRSARSPAFAFRATQRQRLAARDDARITDLRRGGNALVQTADTDCRGRAYHAGVLPGIPARSECRRRCALAAREPGR